MKDVWKQACADDNCFLALAPMYDVTDLPFRRIISECAAPEIYYTEFVSVDALNSPGRGKALRHLDFKLNTKKRESSPGPLIVQIWGKQVENFTAAASELVDMGFDGIDINFGCPVSNVIKNDCCSGLQQIHLRDKALEVINATKEGIKGRVPLSIKTRTGFNTTDFTWHEFLLQQKPAALIVHGRTTKQMSKVPANWGDIKYIRQLRDGISPDTVIVGNGDVATRQEADERAEETGVDGVMIGRGVFSDPFVFAQESPWLDMDGRARRDIYIRHINYHREFNPTDPNDAYRLSKSTAPLKKFAKIYINGFSGAKELRVKFMDCSSYDEMIDTLK